MVDTGIKKALNALDSKYLYGWENFHLVLNLKGCFIYRILNFISVLLLDVCVKKIMKLVLTKHTAVISMNALSKVIYHKMVI